MNRDVNDDLAAVSALHDPVRRALYEYLAVLQRRREWFQRAFEIYSVMWWVPQGHQPSAREGMARLDRLRSDGPGPEAFTFKGFYEPSPQGQ